MLGIHVTSKITEHHAHAVKFRLLCLWTNSGYFLV